MNIIFYVLSFIILFKLNNHYIYYCVFILFVGNIIFEIYKLNSSKIYNYLICDKHVIKPQSSGNNLKDQIKNIKLTAKNIKSLINEKYSK